MNKIFCILFSLSAVVSTAQTAPDNDAILAAITDSGSPYFYPALMLRYETGDTTLTLEDYKHLYYGFAFQDEYMPLEPIPEESYLLMILEGGLEVDYDDAVMVLGYAGQVMNRDPFSPRNINFMTFAYGMIGDTVNEKVSADRLSKILLTIENSGTGLKESEPWHVLWFSHVNDFLWSKDVNIRRRRIISRSVEYAELTEKDGNNKGYYFDYSRIYWKKPDNIPPRERSGMRFGVNKPTYREY